MSYSVAGAKVAVASESGSISFYSRELKEESKKLNAGGAVSALAYSPDGKWLVSILFQHFVIITDLYIIGYWLLCRQDFGI